mgnify:CR=1 FL=1
MKKVLHTVKSKSGVTLIELLVVVVILGIIAAVAIPLVSSNQEDTYKNTNQQNLKIVSEAVQRYSIDNGGQYPTTGTSPNIYVDFTKLVGTYLQAKPDVYKSDGSLATGEWKITDGVVELPADAA